MKLHVFLFNLLLSNYALISAMHKIDLYTEYWKVLDVRPPAPLHAYQNKIRALALEDSDKDYGMFHTQLAVTNKTSRIEILYPDLYEKIFIAAKQAVEMHGQLKQATQDHE